MLTEAAFIDQKYSKTIYLNKLSLFLSLKNKSIKLFFK